MRRDQMSISGAAWKKEKGKKLFSVRRRVTPWFIREKRDGWIDFKFDRYSSFGELIFDIRFALCYPLRAEFFNARSPSFTRVNVTRLLFLFTTTKFKRFFLHRTNRQSNWFTRSTLSLLSIYFFQQNHEMEIIPPIIIQVSLKIANTRQIFSLRIEGVGR